MIRMCKLSIEKEILFYLHMILTILRRCGGQTPRWCPMVHSPECGQYLGHDSHWWSIAKVLGCHSCDHTMFVRLHLAKHWDQKFYLLTEEVVRWLACMTRNCKWSLGHMAARNWALLATNELGRDPKASHAITALANTLISALWIVRLWAETQLGRAQIEDIDLGIHIDIDLHNHRVTWQPKNSGRIFYVASLRQNYIFSGKLQFLLLRPSID